MTIIRTDYNKGLLPAYSYTVEIAGQKKEFLYKHKQLIGQWVKGIWETYENDNGFNVFPAAFIYANIDWGNDHILYRKYERED